MSNLGCIFSGADAGKIAIIDQNRSVTYAQLESMTNWVARDLYQRGYGPGDRIALKGPNTIDQVVTFFGILRLGAVAVMINDRLPEKQIQYIMQDSDARLLIEHPVIDDAVQDDFDAHTVTPNDAAMILYTSGSTADPKGVLLAHRHSWIIEQASQTINWPDRRVLVSAPMCHLNGLSNIEITLCSRATLILLPKFEPKSYLKAIHDHKPSMITSVPTMLARIFQDESISAIDLSSVRIVHMASEPPNKSVFVNIKRYFPNARIMNHYGVTEISAGIFGPHPTKATPITSVGFPRPGIEYRLIDGVLQIKSPSMFIEYTNTTNHRITPDGFFITNDRFSVDRDGFYYFEGRADDMFTCGGHNIYPRQLESVLESHPDVISAAVVPVDHDTKGAKPYAFVVGGPPEEELKQHMLEHLPASHCPRRIWHLDSMPLTNLHKIDKSSLKYRAKDLLHVI